MKLIFLDIDGTLVLPGSMQPSKRVMDAIRAAQSKGHKVFLATGRSRSIVTELLKLNFDGALCSAGAHVTVGNELIYECAIPDELARSTIQLFKSAGMGVVLECGNGTYGAEEFGRVLLAAGTGSSEMERWRKGMQDNPNSHPLSEYHGQPIYKICFASIHQAPLLSIREELEKNFKVCLFDFRPNVTNGEIIYKAFNKATSMERICRYFGADLSDAIAFGDSANDTEMLEAAGIGVCMENGMDEAKAIADYICPSVEDDGVAAAFEKLGLADRIGGLHA